VAGMCDGRVCIVTGGGRGIGHEHALLLAREGAKVVVNDIGVRRDGVPESVDAAQSVVDEIVAMGKEAVANTDDVSTMAGATRLVEQALATWGRLDVIVNNAGILRDRMLVNLTEDDWDSVMAVHLKSTYLLSHLGARHWREKVKAGEPVDARIINTTSASGIYGNVGQTNYGAAKAAIAAFTVISSMEVARYGVTVNAVCPTALTRMTEDLEMAHSTEAQAGALDPRWVSPVVVWLASPLAADVTGRVFVASGRHLGVAEGWVRGPTTAAVAEPEEVDAVIRPLLAAARANSDMRGVPMSRPAT
jgi:NAD(P)-dependent dehydrogenase (short-subunit alcohol dehydrogenase family)